MATEQSTPDSAPSIEDRLTAYFDPAPEAAPVDEPTGDAAESPQIEDSQDQGTDDDIQAEQPAVETFDFTDDEGAVHKLPAKLRDAVERRADYTRKTQHVATLQAKAEDRLMFAEARAQAIGTVLDGVAELKGLQAQLQQYHALDWDSLHRADPAQAFSLSRKMDALKEQVGSKAQAIQQQVQHAQAMAQQHAENQWSVAEKAVTERLGTISQAENIALAKEVQDLGFTAAEFKRRFPDPAIIEAVLNSARWRNLQSGKTATLNSVKNAPPVVKPGASSNEAANVSKQNKLRANLKKTGSVRDAAALLSRLM